MRIYPYTVGNVIDTEAEEYLRSYSKEVAALPALWACEAKIWPAVVCLDNARRGPQYSL